MAFKYPWTNLHELNLDWLLGQIRQLTKQIAKITGLTATAHSLPGASDPTVDVTGGTGDTPYNFDFGIPAGGGGGAVDSVNGQTGDVVLDKDDIGLGNVDNVRQYSADNPPPYPVGSVNGMTGDVIVSGGGGTVGTKQTANIISLYSSEITVLSAYKVVIGDLISYIVKFRNSKASNLNIGILSGFEKPMTTGSGQGAGVSLVTNENTYHAVISSTGTLVIPSNAGIPLGDFTAISTYIKQ